jgi:hypothetical protein
MAGASVSYRTVGQGGWDKPKQGVKVVRMCLRSRSFSFSFTWFALWALPGMHLRGAERATGRLEGQRASLCRRVGAGL